MIIDLNTEQLQTAVQIARAANEAITDAASLLNSVVVHTDWQCPERSEINSNTANNRSQALTLQSDAERFYNNICYAAEVFLEAEQEVASSFNTVDSPIASFLSKTPANVISDLSAGAESAWSTAQDVLQSAGGGIRSAIKQATDVVSFETIADALKGD